jgi:hypothetical protein
MHGTDAFKVKFMSSPKRKSLPITEPYVSGGPPRPPKKTFKGLGDQSPEETLRIRVTVPDAMQGDTLGYLNRLRGAITQIECEMKAWTAIVAILPIGNVQQFKTWLHAYSKGQGRVMEES